MDFSMTVVFFCRKQGWDFGARETICGTTTRLSSMSSFVQNFFFILKWKLVILCNLIRYYRKLIRHIGFCQRFSWSRNLLTLNLSAQ